MSRPILKSEKKIDTHTHVEQMSVVGGRRLTKLNIIYTNNPYNKILRNKIEFSVFCLLMPF